MKIVSLEPGIIGVRDRAALTLIAALSVTLALFLLAFGLSENLIQITNAARALCATLNSMKHRNAGTTAVIIEVDPPAAGVPCAAPLRVDLAQTG